MAVAIDTNTVGDAGWLTNGVPLGTLNTGVECVSVDTQLPGGQQPQTAAWNFQQLATAFLRLTNFKDKTTVAGTIYYTQVNVGLTQNVTGIEVLVGGTGGTDNWCVGLYNSAGVLVANSSLSGATAGTAGGWQQFAFTASARLTPGIYYIAVQSNGTTAKPSTYNAPTLSLVTGSQTGSFGTLAAISAVATTYTANLGPVAQLYV